MLKTLLGIEIIITDATSEQYSIGIKSDRPKNTLRRRHYADQGIKVSKGMLKYLTDTKELHK